MFGNGLYEFYNFSEMKQANKFLILYFVNITHEVFIIIQTKER